MIFCFESDIENHPQNTIDVYSGKQPIYTEKNLSSDIYFENIWKQMNTNYEIEGKVKQQYILVT